MSNEGKIVSYDQFILTLESVQFDQRYQLYKRLKGATPFDRNNWWRWREASRFFHNQYAPILPFDEEWNECVTSNAHFLSTFPHTSKNEPSLISWTPNHEYGIADKRVVGKPGRMLSTVFRLSEGVIQGLVNRFNTNTVPPTLCFAKTFEEISNVYASGPNSCMKKHWPPELSPFWAYATDGRIQVAYLQRNYDIIARTVCRFDTSPPKFTRIYGNEFALRKMLEESGFEYSTIGLEGVVLGRAKVLAVQNKIVLPYIDEPAQFVKLHFETKELVVYKSGPVNNKKEALVSATSQDGTVSVLPAILAAYITPPGQPIPAMRACSDCSKNMLESQGFNTWRHSLVCKSCIDRNYVSAYTTGRISVWVRSDHPDLVHVNCLGTYVINADPEVLFPEVVYSGVEDGFILREQAIYSTVLQSSIFRAGSLSISVETGTGLFEQDVVYPNWVLEVVSDRSYHLYIAGRSRLKEFNSRTQISAEFLGYYLMRGEGSGTIEAIKKQVASTNGMDERDTYAEPIAEFISRAAKYYALHPRSDLVRLVPSVLTAAVRRGARNMVISNRSA